MKTVLSLVLVLTTCSAMAAEKDRPATTEEVQAVFEALDRNDDQKISKQEAAREQSLRRRFAAVDSSGDGYLSRAEYSARPSAEPFE